MLIIVIVTLAVTLTISYRARKAERLAREHERERVAHLDESLRDNLPR